MKSSPLICQIDGEDFVNILSIFVAFLVSMSFTSSRIVTVRFLGELKTPKRHFEIN